MNNNLQSALQQTIESYEQMDYAPFEARKHFDFIAGWVFDQTCPAAPVQYDVYDQDGRQIAYLRERHEKLRCDYPDHDGQTIYRAYGYLDDHLNKIIRTLKLQILNDTKQ
jgi:hypothetical protein